MSRAPSPFQIQQALTVLLSARARMLEDPELLQDDVLIAHILESDPETCSAFDLLHKVTRAAMHARDMAEAAKRRAEEIEARQTRFTNREKTLRGILLSALEALGSPRLEEPDYTLSISPGRPGVRIVDDKALPDAYVRVERVPDKRLISADLQAGVAVPGAELSNPMPYITIRR